MRILNRPMFRTGGPIKEGIMQGMRNGGRAALVGNPVYPQTGGREHHQYVAKDYEAIEKAKNIGQIYDAPFLDKQFRKKWYLDMEPHQVTTGPVDPSRFQFQYMVPDRHLSKPKFRKRSDIITDPKAYDYYKKEYIEDEWRKKIDKQKELLTKAGDERVSSLYEYEVPTKAAGTTSRWDKTAPTLTSSQREDLAKKQQGERLKTYLDMMGYDSAKKGAMSKALIDASALVQDATTEAGSIKHADWGNLINKAIQTTSKRLDKPAQIREAVGLMMTKGEIEKDIAKGKENALDQQVSTLMNNLGYDKATATRVAKGLPKDLREQVIVDMGTSKQALTHSSLTSSVKKWYPQAIALLDTTEVKKKLGNQSAEEFITDKIKNNPTTNKIYIVGKEVVKVDGEGRASTIFP